MNGKQEIYFEIVHEIERHHPVAKWRVGDIPVWPMLRLALENAVYDIVPKNRTGAEGSGQRWSPVITPLSYALTPLANLWRTRSGFQRVRLHLTQAHALFLGNGGTADRIDGRLQDRFCEPIATAYEEIGKTSFLMEHGDVRVPWMRPVYAANTIDRWARLSVAVTRAAERLPFSLQGHSDVLALLERKGLPGSVLAEGNIRRRGALIQTMSKSFDRVLDRVRPRVVFAVCYYSDIAYGLMHACRRKGILSVDIQHGGQGGAHKAYNQFLNIPEEGYSVLPAVFWNWTQDDADAINSWAGELSRPWHRAINGGHPQLAPWFDDNNSQTRAFDEKIAATKARAPASRDILVTLQDLDQYKPTWDTLADFIERVPTDWRWWLRRHPSPHFDKSRSTGKLLALNRSNVFIDEASNMPLPALLRHMDVAISMTSGAMLEASWFGVKTAFLSEDARTIHPGLVNSGQTKIVPTMSELEAFLSMDIAGSSRSFLRPQLDLQEALAKLEAFAGEYQSLAAHRS